MQKIVNDSYVNPSICKECGGLCCKKSGCDYYPRDFRVINKEEIIKVLDTGNVSIVSTLMFSFLPNGRKNCDPFLYLRARNIDRGIIDLLSLKKTCSMLRDYGCFYSNESRPSGGLNLIPSEVKPCKTIIDPRKEILEWSDYQNLLSKLVKRYTHKSVDEVLREDVENLFYDFFEHNFDGVMEKEIYETATGLGDLKDCFPEQYDNAKKRSKKAYNTLR